MMDFIGLIVGFLIGGFLGVQLTYRTLNNASIDDLKIELTRRLTIARIKKEVTNEVESIEK